MSRAATTQPKIHLFTSTGDAYDASQCDDNISNGDILVVPSEGAIAILCDAWPVALTLDTVGRHFHTFKVIGDKPYDDGWKSENYIRFEPSVIVARRIVLNPRMRED